MGYLLEPLGISKCDNDLYLALVQRGSAQADDLAAAVAEGGDPSPSAVVTALNRLVTLGLAHRTSFGEPRFRAISPDVALAELIRERRHQLTQMQDAADRIASRLTSSTERSDGVVEEIRGTSAIVDAIVATQRRARHEVRFIDAPPYFAGGVQPNDIEYTVLAANVRYRTVYHPDALRSVQERTSLASYVEAGEEARLLVDAWPKMVVADRRMAVIPVSMADPDPERRLLVHTSSLLDLLVAHFDALWERATPISAAGEVSEEDHHAIGPRDRELLTLLVAGLKDRAIARSLGVTERTVGRRINELARRLDVDTRFQLGVRAAQRGLVA